MILDDAQAADLDRIRKGKVTLSQAKEIAARILDARQAQLRAPTGYIIDAGRQTVFLSYFGDKRNPNSRQQFVFHITRECPALDSGYEPYVTRRDELPGRARPCRRCAGT